MTRFRVKFPPVDVEALDKNEAIKKAMKIVGTIITDDVEDLEAGSWRE